MFGRRAIPLATAFALICLGPAASGQEGDVELGDYTVTQGDTCVGIAIRELGDRRKYKEIHKYNPMGPLPHKLKPGSILRLPKPAPTGPDANLSSRRGQVQVRHPQKSDWGRALLGMDLFRRWRVSSQKRSTAEITFRDTSRLRMRENTIVIIYGPTAGRAKRKRTRATLERGELRTRLAELDGKKSELLVETPSSEAELDGGSALISVDDSATSRISNHEGKPARVRKRAGKRKKRGRATRVAAGMGSKVEKGKDPTPPKALPPTPTWQAGDTAFAGWAHRGATLRGSWAPVADAAEYRVEISRDADGADVVANVTVPATVSSFEAHGFPSGEYYVSLAARDNDKFESAPSARRRLVSAVLSLVPFGQDAGPAPIALAADQAIDPTSGFDSLRVLPGSRVIAPSDLTCAIGGGEPAAEQTLRAAGNTELRCKSAEHTLAPLPLEVVNVAMTEEGQRSVSGRLVPRTRPVSMRVVIASDVEIPIGKLTTTVSTGFEIIERRDSKDAIEVMVAAHRNAPDVGTLQLSYGAGGPLALSIPLELEPTVARRKPPELRRRRWELGALVGGNMLDDEYQLGNAPSEAGVLQGSWLVGARLGLHFTPSFALELEGTYGEPKFAGLIDHANVIGYRAQGVLLLREGRLRPFVLAGFGGAFMSTNSLEARNDTDKEGHWGLGLRLSTGIRSAVRVDVRHRISGGRQSSFSNVFEASLGLGWML